MAGLNRRMDVERFPVCCSAVVFCSFPEGYEEWIPKLSKKEIALFKKDMIDNVERYKHFLITAITTQEQKLTNATLRELGFRRTTWKSKKRIHPNNRIAMWWKDPIAR